MTLAVDRKTSVFTNPVTGMSLRILRTPVESGGAVLEMEATYPPGSSAPPAHFHPQQEERLVLLDGGMQAEVGGTQRHLVAGDHLVIPPGTSHTMWNPGPGSSRVNWQVRPALRTLEFFQVVFSLAAKGRVNEHGVPRLLDLALFMPHFRHQFQVTSPPALVQRLVFGTLGPLARLLDRCPELRNPSWPAA